MLGCEACPYRIDDEGNVRTQPATVEEIANRPTIERNPDGVDQAAASMQLIAREALEATEEKE